MKTTKLVFLFIAFATLSLTSCKKDDPEPTKTELLTGDWNYVKYEEYVNGDLDESENATETIIVTFNADHTGRSTVDGNLNATFTWSFNSDETVLTLFTTEDEIYDIEKLDNSNLWLSSTETDSNGDTIKELDILKK